VTGWFVWMQSESLVLCTQCCFCCLWLEGKSLGQLELVFVAAVTSRRCFGGMDICALRIRNVSSKEEELGSMG